MDFLRSQFVILQERLAALTASQRMLVAAMAVICVMTLLYWGKFAGTRDRVPLPVGSIAGDQLATVVADLKARGIEATIENGAVMVSASQQFDAMGVVSFNGQLSSNATNAIDSALDKTQVFGTNALFGARMNSAKQQYLGMILAKWPGVKTADVVITDTSGASSLSRRDPRLAVYLQTKGTGVDRRKLATSARSFMANCLSGLKPDNIAISIDGTFTVAGGENDTSVMSGDLLATKREAEADCLGKLQQLFSGIPGVLVSVSVEVNNASSTTKSRDVDPKNKINEQLTSETRTQTPVGDAAPQSDVGLVPNVGRDLTGGGSAVGPSGFATEEAKSTYKVDYGTKEVLTNNPGGTCSVVGASISVPHSYFVAVWRQKQKSADAAAAPSDAELQPVVDDVLNRVKKSTVAVTGIKDESRISVADFWDLDPIVGGPVLAVATPGGAAGNLTSFAAGNAKEIMLGVLAVASLFMVGRLVKKAEPILAASAPGLALAGVGGVAVAGGEPGESGTDPAARPRPKFINGEAIAGEVGNENNPAVMFGQELDPEALETSQMIDQVSSFVKTNPESAAQMINRWMSRD